MVDSFQQDRSYQPEKKLKKLKDKKIQSEFWMGVVHVVTSTHWEISVKFLLCANTAVESDLIVI